MLDRSGIAASISMNTTSQNMNPIAQTTRGAVRGTDEDGISVFRGIPYAEPPVGKLRFRPPVLRQRWDGVRNAMRFGEIVPQTDESPFDKMLLPDAPQGDDCLNLNVSTPDPGQAALPVLVWIHGGTFKWGAGSSPLFDGATFARHGVVTVTLNYRLGASGFLYVGDRPGSGNFGILDQIAALQWVQDNIAAFGGHPRESQWPASPRVPSASGNSSRRQARGLFMRAILQSGGTQTHIGTKAASLIGADVLARLGVRLDGDGIDEITTTELLEAQMAAEPKAIEVPPHSPVTLDLFWAASLSLHRHPVPMSSRNEHSSLLGVVKRERLICWWAGTKTRQHFGCRRAKRRRLN